MNQYSHFAIEEAKIIRQDTPVDPDQWRLIRRLRIPDKFNDPQGGTVKQGEPSRVCRRLFGLSHATMAGSLIWP
jgi:hypothetical protein